MTRQYLAGELSLMLGQLEATVSDPEGVREVASLRHEAEALPVCDLGSLVSRALALSDKICLHSVESGSWAAFSFQTSICSELWRFGVGAGLLAD
ncbi:MAG: hypothetical protein WB801_07470 [Candidatus Dormiibacterota bacterium]